MEEKDFSLLRPFDLEAAKRGEAICYAKGTPAKYIAGPNRLGTVVIHWKDDQFHFTSKSNLRMAPLCWVEGRPVYTGDVLYWGSEEYVISGADIYRGVLFSESHAEENGEPPCPAASSLTWNPPKREVKLLAWFSGSSIRWLTDGTPVPRDFIRVPSEDKVIEVEA